MIICRLVRADLRIGIWKKSRYLVFVILCLFCCGIFTNVVPVFAEVTGEQSLSMADCMAYLQAGIYPLIRKPSGDTFQLPVIWLMLMLLYLMMPLDHPVRSRELWGSPYLLRAGRGNWWLAKCVYTLAVNTLTFGLYAVTVALFCLVRGISLSMVNHAGFYGIVFGTVDQNFQGALSAGENLLLLVLLPLLGLYALSLVQLLMSVWVHPMAAYSLTVVLLVFSVYANEPWLWGNQTMAIRSSLIDCEGIAPGAEALWCVGACAAVIITGWILIKRTDVIRLKKEAE